MKYRLQDLIDIEHFQNLQDRLNGIYSFPSSIIDNEGNILTATAWQDICTQFHRKNKDCEKLCIKSDQYIKDHIHEANPAVSYQCPHGLVDNATPIIIDGIHYGNFFTGQFFLEKPDLDFFRAQAKKYGFNEEAYIDVVKKVPIWTQEQLNSYLYFIKELISVISESGLKNLKEAEAKKKVEESEERLRLTTNNIPNGYVYQYTQDAEGKPQFLYVSNGVAEVHPGIKPEDVLKDATVLLDLIDPEQILAYKDAVDLSARRIKDVFMDLRMHVIDHEYKWIRFQSKPRKDDKGRVFWDGAVTDITERKKMEEALRASQQMMEEILNAVPVRVFWKDNNLVYLGCNAVFARDAGFDSPEDIVGKDDYQMGWRDQADLYRGDDRQVIESGYAKLLIEEPQTTPEGNIITLLTNKIPLHNPKGEVIGILGTYMDITERKIAEEALKISEAKYRSMMEAMDDPAYICSKDFRVEYMNTAMINRLGHDATGERCHRAMHGLDEKCPWCIHEKVMGGQSVRIEITSPKDGKIFHVSNFPIFNQPGFISKLTIFRDITEIKQMEDKLRQAQKMESIGTLAGGIAHDFNNILAPLLGFAELLKEEIPAGSPLQDHINEILQATLRSKDLVKRILEFSRKGGKNAMPIQLNPVIKEVLNFLRSSIPTTIDIHQDIDADCGTVIADPTQIHQIVMNLVTNAFHAVEDAGGKITVSLKQVELIPGLDTSVFSKMAPGRYVLLTVADTGTGIEKEILDKIFDPYFSTKGVGKGTGLGLSVVHGIVKAHNGEIMVDSQPGKGTLFQVYLPIVKLTTIDKPTDDFESIPGGTEKILLVDDELAIVRVEQLMLERLGYHVTAQNSSIDTLETFKANPNAFDLVFSDMTMPHMTGIELAEKLIARRPDIPIIICTGNNEKLSEEKAESVGIKGVLIKPVVKYEMAEMVRRVLDGVRG